MSSSWFPDAASDSAFGLTFWIGIGVGFVLGILGSYLGNYLWDRQKSRRRGVQPYFEVQGNRELIHFEGQVQNTNESLTALFQTFQADSPKKNE